MKIKEAAELTGVSIRTLYHYDDIGLISPERSVLNDYREYTDEDYTRLQQILFFKELGFKLSSIKEIINRPEYDKEEVLAKQKEMLHMERERISTMIETIDLTIKNLKGEVKMSNADKFKGIDFSQNPYEQEARERWGDDAVNRSNEKLGQMKFKSADKRFDEIYKALADVMHMDPGSDEVQNKIEDWYVFLNEIGDYSLDMFKGLGDIYVADERFKKNIDQYGTGLAEFMRAAMSEYHDKNK